jgi:hypothetical protein
VPLSLDVSCPPPTPSSFSHVPSSSPPSVTSPPPQQHPLLLQPRPLFSRALMLLSCYPTPYPRLCAPFRHWPPLTSTRAAAMRPAPQQQQQQPEALRQPPTQRPLRRVAPRGPHLWRMPAARRAARPALAASRPGPPPRRRRCGGGPRTRTARALSSRAGEARAEAGWRHGGPPAGQPEASGPRRLLWSLVMGAARRGAMRGGRGDRARPAQGGPRLPPCVPPPRC